MTELNGPELREREEYTYTLAFFYIGRTTGDDQEWQEMVGAALGLFANYFFIFTYIR